MKKKEKNKYTKKDSEKKRENFFQKMKKNKSIPTISIVDLENIDQKNQDVLKFLKNNDSSFIKELLTNKNILLSLKNLNLMKINFHEIRNFIKKAFLNKKKYQKNKSDNKFIPIYYPLDEMKKILSYKKNMKDIQNISYDDKDKFSSHLIDQKNKMQHFLFESKNNKNFDNLSSEESYSVGNSFDLDKNNFKNYLRNIYFSEDLKDRSTKIILDDLSISNIQKMKDSFMMNNVLKNSEKYYINNNIKNTNKLNFISLFEGLISKLVKEEYSSSYSEESIKNISSANIEDPRKELDLEDRLSIDAWNEFMLSLKMRTME